MMERSYKIKKQPPPLSKSSSPWLLYTHGKGKTKKIQTLCTLPPFNKKYIKRIRYLREKCIFACFDDWLVFRLYEDDNENIFYLWNIVTPEKEPICLPECHALAEYIWGITSCALVNDRNCGLVLFLFCGDADVFFCRVSEGSSWVCQTIELDIYDGSSDISWVENVAALDGILYCRVETRLGYDIITIEFDKDDPNLLIFKSLEIEGPPFHLCCHYPRSSTSMVQSCGLIYYFLVSFQTLDTNIEQIVKVFVWQLDLNLKRWVVVEQLGNRAFFLGNKHCSTWCWAESSCTNRDSGRGFEANCVYLARGRDPSLYLYRLENDSVVFLPPCPSLQMPFYGPVWIMPQHLRTPWKFDSKMLDKGVTIENQCNMTIKRTEQEHNESGQSLLIHLPSDIIRLISKYMHLFDYTNFRVSCKTFWSALSPQYHWRSKKSIPLFMHSKDGKGLCELRDPFRIDSMYISIPHSPAVPTGVDFSKDGWLIVCTNGESLQFFNPFTGEEGKFPPFESAHRFRTNSLGLSTYPTSSDCLTVQISDTFSNSCLEILSYKSGDKMWKTHEFNLEYEDINEFKLGNCSPVYYNGAFYFLDKEGSLGEFKLVEESSSWKTYNEPELSDELHSSHLVKCAGKLLAVFIGEVGKWIRVFKFNRLKEEWHQIRNLKNHCLFIGHRSSLSAMTKAQGVENRIYLPWRKGDDLVYYSLKTRKYHTDGSQDVMKSFYGMTGQSLCCWV